MAMVALVVYGLTGCGKSTLASLLKEELTAHGRSTVILKLADPLYRLQRAFYEIASRPEEQKQDQILLEVIATQLRRISPTSVVDDFLLRLDQCGADTVINDDLRDPHIDYLLLKQRGFKFIRLVCSETVRQARLGQRDDISTIVQSKTTAELDLIVSDLVIDNSGCDIGALKGVARHIIRIFA